MVKTLMGLGQAGIESTKSSIPMAFSLAMTPAPIADAPAVRDAAEDEQAAAAVAPMKAVAASCPIPPKIGDVGSDAYLPASAKWIAHHPPYCQALETYSPNQSIHTLS